MTRFRFLLLLLAASPLLFSQTILAGTENGIYKISEAGASKLVLPPEMQVKECRKIIKSEAGWFFLTDRGIVFSSNLIDFELRNKNLPVKVLKTFPDNKKQLVSVIHELKDLEFDPYNPLTIITCTKDEAYVSYDAGLTWTGIGNPSDTNGIKAVAVFSKPKLTVLLSSSIRGLFSKELPKGSWKAAEGTFSRSCPTTSPDEIADIQIQAGEAGTQIWAVNSFLPSVYRASGSNLKFERIFSAPLDFFSLDSIALNGTGFIAVSDRSVLRFAPETGFSPAKDELSLLSALQARMPAGLLCVYAPGPLVLSELWQLSEKVSNAYTAQAVGKNGIYLQTGYAINAKTRQQYVDLAKKNKLNMITIDVKDDYGRLRYVSNDPLVKSMYKPGSTLDIDSFAKEMKEQGIYLVARIVVFKDQHMFEYAGGKFAVYDTKTKAPWRGYRLIQTTVAATAAPVAATAAPAAGQAATSGSAGKTGTTAAPAAKTTTTTTTQYYGEYWVDPYCEQIWQYNVAIAREVLARGFDEVQFDYIRFPTDGVNIGDASFRWKDAGMDKESALMSFLQYAREHIPGPISIDIYGANGWYRSGVRTGQDVELLSRYADVICPMFYPSHFEQGFMAFSPAELRPYRIYKIGNLRTLYIGKKRIVVRPYVQAFYLNVSYDKLYYSPAYVGKEVDGVYQSTNQGMTFWNNVGRYDDIPVMQPPQSAASIPNAPFLLPGTAEPQGAASVPPQSAAPAPQVTPETKKVLD